MTNIHIGDVRNACTVNFNAAADPYPAFGLLMTLRDAEAPLRSSPGGVAEVSQVNIRVSDVRLAFAVECKRVELTCGRLRIHRFREPGFTIPVSIFQMK